MNAPTLPSRLTRRDCAVLVLLCLLVHGFALVYPRGLTTHEAVHCQNVREMFTGGDWLIPSYGGRPWLERPPLPHWLTGLGAALAGTFESDWAMRLGPLLAGCATVLLTGWMASVFFGRGAGLLAGAVLATMREFVLFAKGTEADIFLCFLVTAALALFVRYEFVDRRRRVLLAFFVVAGLTNWAKGPLFGTVFFVAVPVALYFLWNADGAGLLRMLWPPGLLVYAVLAAAWPLAAYLRHPDVVDLWFSDFGDRWSKGYIGEPPWYYLGQWPWNVFPWTAPAVAGLWLSARPAFREGDRAARWLWCSALAPVVALSLPQGKHHHYLLSCQPAWAVLGALGAVRLWRWLNEECRWRSRPWPVLAAIALAGDAALLLVR